MPCNNTCVYTGWAKKVYCFLSIDNLASLVMVCGRKVCHIKSQVLEFRLEKVQNFHISVVMLMSHLHLCMFALEI